MKIAHDVFAETNPAFGTFALVGFCSGYCAVSPIGPLIAIVYLAMPIAMSRDMEASFSSTNRTTGLLAWINRYPDVRINLGQRLDASLDIVTESIRLGLLSEAIVFNEVGGINLGANTLTKAAVSKLPLEPKKVIRRAERLGHWMSKSGSASSVFSAFGVTL